MPGAQAAAEEPCRRRRSGWGGWRWGSGSYGYSNYDRSRSSYSGRPPGSVSTALRPSGSGSRSTGTPSATSSSPRGGFGTTGHSMSSRGSGGGS
jgi:hypothetical protein